MPCLRIFRSFFFMLMYAICCSQAEAQVLAGKAVQAGSASGSTASSTSLPGSVPSPWGL